MRPAVGRGLAARAPAKARRALARARRARVGRRRGFERLGPDAERKIAGAHVRHLHRAHVVAGDELAGQLLHDERLPIRKAVREAEDRAAMPRHLAHQLDQLLQRVLARAAELVDLAVRRQVVERAAHGGGDACGHAIGGTGNRRASSAKVLRKASSGPKMTEGRNAVTARPAAPSAACSPIALVRRYSDGAFADAPSALICNSLPTPRARHAATTARGNSACTRSKSPCRMPTRLITACLVRVNASSAPGAMMSVSMTSTVGSGSRCLARSRCRVGTATLTPSAARAATRWRPTNPEPPSTRTLSSFTDCRLPSPGRLPRPARRPHAPGRCPGAL